MNAVIPFLLLATAIKTVQPAYHYGMEQNLRSDLGIGTTYNKLVRPNEQVIVTVSLNVLTLNSLSISDQSMSLSGYLTMMWEDDRIEWESNVAYLKNIKAIYSNEESIWRPTLTIENSVKDISIVSDVNILMRLKPDGHIIWTPSGIYVTYCETDVTYYPFDTQSCDVIITTWGYTSEEIALNVSTEAVQMEYYKENGEWNYQGFLAFTTFYTRGGLFSPEITFRLTFKRRPMFHVLNSLVPMVLLAFLSSMVFKLPPDSGERIGYTLTVLLAYAVYLTIISDNMPSSSSSISVLSKYVYLTVISDNMPSSSSSISFLAIYLLFVLLMGVMSVIITIYVLDCHHKDEEFPVPKWLIRMSTCLAKFAGWKGNSCCSVRKVKPFGEFDSMTWKDIGESEFMPMSWSEPYAFSSTTPSVVYNKSGTQIIVKSIKLLKTILYTTHSCLVKGIVTQKWVET
ncbi:unnamed protein product [Mytilus coruscus]|uniref:CHRNN n=1 Tax=Mytilus coruscus TaxID=42192 RepID=A0A6J8E0U5_MYTCO|nr:unnamed protein product [Mytilus coruscus]